MAVFASVWLGAITPSILAAADASAPANIF